MPISEALVHRFQQADLEIGLLIFPKPPLFKMQHYGDFFQQVFKISHNEARLQKVSDGSSQLLNSKRQISISHKENSLCLALAAHNNIETLGCDIESLKAENRDWRPFIGRFFNALDISQIALYKNKNNLSENEAYLTFFSIKESILKATKLTVDPIAFSVGHNDRSGDFFINAPETTGLSPENFTIGKFHWNEWLITFAYKPGKAL